MPTWFTLLRSRSLIVRAHYSWLLVFPLAIWSLGRLVLPGSLPEGAGAWIPTLLIVVVYIASLAIHEGAHLLAARLLHVPMPALNLHPIGTLVRRGREASGPRRSFAVAAAGPIANLIVLLLLGARASEVPATVTDVVLRFAAQANFMLAVVNLLPCLPLDGGRMLRAFLWRVHDSFIAATRIATNLNPVVSGLTLLLGLRWLADSPTSVRGMWTILLAWLIYEAGTSLARRKTVGQLFERLTAGDVMTPARETVRRDLLLSDLILLWRGRSGENPAPVVSDGMLLGLITRSRANDIMQGYWGERTVEDAMIPAAELPLVARDTPLSEVLPLIDPEALDPLPLLVVDAGRLEGLIVQREVQPLLEVEEAVALARGTESRLHLKQDNVADAEPVAGAPPASGQR